MPRSDAAPTNTGTAARTAPKKTKKKGGKLAPSDGGVKKASAKKKQRRSSKSSVTKKTAARPKKSSSVAKKRAAPVVNYAGITLPSAAAARAVSLDKKEKQAQRMAQYRRRNTLETRVGEFFERVGGSALLVTATSGGAKRGGRRSLVGSGHYGPGFLDSTLHDQLSEVFEHGVDWRHASKKLTMRMFLVAMCPDRHSAADDKK